MYPIERQKAILSLVNKRKSVSVSQIAEAMDVGEATIRRDLAGLEKLGHLKRTHGGAVSLDGLGNELPIDVRQEEQARSKALMAKGAAGMVACGMTVFLDASTTCMRLLPHLARIPSLTVVTNGARTAARLAELPDITAILIGGVLNRSGMAYMGSMAQEALSGLNADICFVSCRGVSIESGITDSQIELAELKRMMLRRAKKKVLIAAQAKFSATSFVKICDVSEVDCIVTDGRPNMRWREYLAERKIQWLCE